MEYLSIVSETTEAQGAIFYLENELMNVIVKSPEYFTLGEKVTCCFEHKKIKATIIKKAEFNLYLFFSMSEGENLNIRRKSIRCNVQIPGIIQKIDSLPIPVTISDISITGIGFTTTKNLTQNEIYQLRFTLYNETISAKIIIKNKLEIKYGFRCGSILEINDEQDLFHIRKFILNYQLNKI